MHDSDGAVRDAITLNHAQTVARLKDIESELERLNARAEDPDTGLTEREESYWEELVTEAGSLERHKKDLKREADRAIVAAMAGNAGGAGAVTVERGADYVDRNLPDDPSKRRFKDPWDFSEMRSGLSPEAQASEFRARALSAIELMPATTDKRREAMTALIETSDTPQAKLARLALVTGSETYVSAFGKLISNDGAMAALSVEEQRAVVEARAMSTADGSGGYLIPMQLDPSVILTADGSFNEVRKIARVVNATGDVWHGVASAGITGSWDGEAVEVSDDAPTLTQPTITVHKLQMFVPISIEALADAQNVAQEVAGLIAFEKDLRESIAFVTGSGTSQPWGVHTRLAATTNSRVTTGTADAFSLPDLYKIDEQLPARYRFRASWLAHRAIYNDIRAFDTSGGAALWTQLQGDVPMQLIGRPTYESEAMPTGASGTNVCFLIFGDFNNYVIADRVGTTVEFVPHLFGASGRPTGQRGWYAYTRVGADTVNAGGLRILNGQ